MNKQMIKQQARLQRQQAARTRQQVQQVRRQIEQRKARLNSVRSSELKSFVAQRLQPATFLSDQRAIHKLHKEIDRLTRTMRELEREAVFRDQEARTLDSLALKTHLGNSVAEAEAQRVITHANLRQSF